MEGSPTFQACQPRPISTQDGVSIVPISFASMFTGCGQADLAARSLGMELVGAIEHDAPIAAVYADNFGSRHLTIGDVADFDFRQWKGLDHLHASNSCKPHAFGRANGDPKDHAQYASAYEICRALKVIQPQTFTLENSPNFARSEPYRAIMGVLLGLGYGIFAGNLNASDFGVPQDAATILYEDNDGATAMANAG